MRNDYLSRIPKLRTINIGRYELDSPSVPVALVATMPDGAVINREVFRDRDGTIHLDTMRFYADVKERGAKVSGRYRVASHQKVVRTDPPA